MEATLPDIFTIPYQFIAMPVQKRVTPGEIMKGELFYLIIFVLRIYFSSELSVSSLSILI